jgi:putative isomerase
MTYRGAIESSRAWNTWDSVYPADLVHLPSGLRVSFCAYAASRNAFTRFPPGEGVRLGPRAIDGARAALDLAHAGTEFAIAYEKVGDRAVVGSWRTRRFGEWGLRFWPMLVLQTEEGPDPEWCFDESSGVVSGRGLTVVGERAPLLVTYHASLEALAEELRTRGYFYLASREARGPVVALRYNLEEMPSHRFAVTIGGEDEARAALAAGGPAPEPSRHAGRGAGALDAVRDVIGWNTVWDPVNRRPYTSLSRHWVAQKFGGFGVWLDDVFYHGLMAGLLDPRIARDNVEAVLAGATEQGNLPCLLTGNDAWIDRSQPPTGSFVTWLLHLRSRDRSLIERAFPVLRANHDWWWRTRDGNANGLLEYGTSPVGRGLYRGTKLAAKDESMMDNSPVHDEARLVPGPWTLDCEDVALNSLLALDGEMLGLMARELGDEAEAERLEIRAEVLKRRIAAELWDPDRRVFANRLWSGRFVRSLAPTSFFPLIAGAASHEQAKDLVERHLLNEREFWGEWVVPAVARNDPAFADNVYWRGRVWPPLNLVTYYGLRRAGFAEVAVELARKSRLLFMRNWEASRHCGENFSAVTGAILDQPDTDPFYAWGALLALIDVAETIDVDPWAGWTLTNHGEDVALGPLLTPVGPTTVTVRGGRLALTADGRVLVATDARGRWSRLRVEPGRFEGVAPADASGTRTLWLPHVPRATVRAATCGDRPLEPHAGESGSVFLLPAGGGALAIAWASQDRDGTR